jgi:hypothetical protein
MSRVKINGLKIYGPANILWPGKERKMNLDSLAGLRLFPSAYSPPSSNMYDAGGARGDCGGLKISRLTPHCPDIKAGALGGQMTYG